MAAPLKKPHAVVLCFPELGHAIPLARLSFRLASMDSYAITILSPPSFTQAPSFLPRLSSLLPPPSLQSQLQIDIRLVEVPFHGADHHLKHVQSDSHLGNVFLAIEAMQQQQAALEALIQSLDPPVTCIISDTFLFWTRDLALSLNIPRALFWTSSATMLVSLSKPQGERALDEVENCLDFTRHPLVAAFKEKQLRRIDDARCILVNSFEELEDIAREEAVLPIPLHPIGPLLPEMGDLREEIECMQWLDCKAASSVIYIAFGTVFRFQEMEELASGIEASNKPFLWAFREPDGEAARWPRLPYGFAERMKHRGLIVPWTPQLRVLTHPSVGCYFTHCGWNSVMESIYAGVPMLCCPLFGDQILNKELVVRKWQIGIEAKRKEDGSIGAQEITRGIEVLMESKEGKEIQRQSEKMRETARSAMRARGSSHGHLAAFLQGMAL